MYPGGRFILTDAYPGEPVSFGDETVPIRWVDLNKETETTLIRIRSKPAYEGPKHSRDMRLDPHPAWDRSLSYVVFNGCPDGYRHVFIADMRKVVGRHGL